MVWCRHPHSRASWIVWHVWEPAYMRARLLCGMTVSLHCMEAFVYSAPLAFLGIQASIIQPGCAAAAPGNMPLVVDREMHTAQRAVILGVAIAATPATTPGLQLFSVFELTTARHSPESCTGSWRPLQHWSPYR